MSWKNAARRAADACDALGLGTESAALKYARSPDSARRASMRAEERAVAIETAARFMARTTLTDPAALHASTERAQAISEACCDLNEEIETYELAGA